MMLARRLLPLNVQFLICSYLPRPSLPASVPLGAARLHATVSLAAPPPADRQLPAASHSAQPFTRNSHLVQETAQAVFEEPSDEYESVPLSTLDHPPVPRSPDDSLLSLLDAEKPQDARRLLYELRAAGQPIPARYAFFRHARAWAEAPEGSGLFARNEHGERDWLEWWKLAPSITDPVHPEVENLRGVVKAMDNAASKILRQLRAAPALTGAAAPTTAEGSVADALALLEEFCLVLCRQGLARVVAVEAFPYLTAYAPPEVGERVFTAALRSLRQHRSSFVAQGAYLSQRRRIARSRTRDMLPDRRGDLLSRVVHRRMATTRTWFLNRQNAALEALVHARGAAVLAHANLGRLATAVDLVVATTRPGETSLARVKLDRGVYLRLLELLADRDEFALFSRTYDSLRAGSRRLTRTRSAALRERTPFLIRGSAFDPQDVAPNAREAFLAWRYQNAVSAIEEGPEASLSEEAALAGLVEEEEARAATGEIGGPRAKEASVRLVHLVEADDASGSCFADSARYVARALVEASGRGSGKGKGAHLPSANALAVWILHARGLTEQTGDPHFGDVLYSLALEAHAGGPATRGMWVSGTMLADIQAGRYVDALEAFKTHFAVMALPEKMRVALWAATHDRRPRKVREDTTAMMPPSAYTLALLVQALVPWYAARATTARFDSGVAHARGVIRELYDELLLVARGEAPVAIVPSHTRARRARSVDEGHRGDDALVQLDPYTFVPFLLDHLRHRQPLAAAGVLADMHEHGIEPQPPHYSVLLNAFARGGGVRGVGRRAEGSDSGAHADAEADAAEASTTAADLLFLLRLFERRAPTFAAAEGNVSPSVRALAARLPVPASDVPLGVHAYTGILSGLRRRGERGAALEVLKGLMEERGEDVRVWAKGDERFREEVVLLGKASGVSAAGTL